MLNSIFLEGPAGAGKTTRGIAQIRSLVESGVSPSTILLLTPHRSYAVQYRGALDQQTWHALGKATIGGLARRYVALFWPEILPHSIYPFEGSLEPTFLTYEAAQFWMARIVSPLVEQGYFVDLKLARHRLYSQLLDNLNKLAVNDISIDDLGIYLQAATPSAEPASGRVEEISSAVESYRQFCAKHNLVDFSLYMELFQVLMREVEVAQSYLHGQYRYIIYDNCEEDVPVAHDFVSNWIKHPKSELDSVLIIYDRDAGFRKFLAANPQSAYHLKAVCAEAESIDESPSVPPSLVSFGTCLINSIANDPLHEVEPGSGETSFHVYSDRLHHQMVLRVVGQVVSLVERGHSPQDIVIISPFLSDSLYYGLSTGLEQAGVSYCCHRPSRSLRDEPVTKVLMTLALLAHPSWGLARPSQEAVSHMFTRVLAGADLVRAAVLARAVYDPIQAGVGLKPFEEVSAEVRDRVTYRLGESYEKLRVWLEGYLCGEALPIDHFLSRVFGELISQPGFGFHGDVSSGGQIGTVVESCRKFRISVATVLEQEDQQVGEQYVKMVQEGVVSGYYGLESVDILDAVLIAPAHTYLLRNRSCAHQFWLDVGSDAWHRRIHQPLTNPYVLSREWNRREQWSAGFEQRFEKERLTRIVLGLVRRCTDSVHLFASELSSHGQEQTGDLLVAVGHAMRELGE